MADFNVTVEISKYDMLQELDDEDLIEEIKDRNSLACAFTEIDENHITLIDALEYEQRSKGKYAEASRLEDIKQALQIIKER